MAGTWMGWEPLAQCHGQVTQSSKGGAGMEQNSKREQGEESFGWKKPKLSFAGGR